MKTRILLEKQLPEFDCNALLAEVFVYAGKCKLGKDFGEPCKTIRIDCGTCRIECKTLTLPENAQNQS